MAGGGRGGGGSAWSAAAHGVDDDLMATNLVMEKGMVVVCEWHRALGDGEASRVFFLKVVSLLFCEMSKAEGDAKIGSWGWRRAGWPRRTGPAAVACMAMGTGHTGHWQGRAGVGVGVGGGWR